ncbi:hypothetical protein BDFB_001339 [Asbolus verrucosus]|uniref:Uncharacterized protein n=1 Tax=Asbolus verrucosus TaxID=1661398 RepID=A0A482VK01_ASBVE|nr:hypothetical protein BDFB_001339 [Asbolus verrucosus]
MKNFLEIFSFTMLAKIVSVVLMMGTVFSEKNVSLLEQKEEPDVNISTKFHKFEPPNWLRPIADKVSSIVALTKHPNFGGFQLLNPQNLWEKLHEKGGAYLTGSQGTTFGTSNSQVDYPFAYRKTKN